MITSPQKYRCQICGRLSENKQSIIECEKQGILPQLLSEGDTFYFKNSPDNIEFLEKRFKYYSNFNHLNLLDKECVKIIDVGLTHYKQVRQLTVTYVSRNYDGHGYFYNIKEAMAVYDTKSFTVPHLIYPFFNQDEMEYVLGKQEEYKREYLKK